tara:strand:+ start:4701 stop:5972 length:1272 start_codon:yes stop_codon:yes gene_type:complete
MKKKILVKGPAFSRSGYGEHTRFLLRSLRPHEENYDIYLINIPWGHTGFFTEETEFRAWMDSILQKTIEYGQSGGQFDLSAQVTIPNEWEKIAPINIGITAGIEVTKVSPQWLAKGNEVDKIIVVSEHAKQVYETSTCIARNEATGHEVNDYHCETSIEVIHYPVREFEEEKIEGFKLDYDFNFLAVAQWGPRKNLENTITWFLEEFKDEEVGLVVKANLAKDCIIDREILTQKVLSLVEPHKERKCKIYLLHGELKPEQMSWLYKHKKIKSMVSLTHGEGFGLPLFEAAYNGLPIVAPLWSGQVDFLRAPNKNGKLRPMIAKVGYTLQPVPPEVVWAGVIEEGTMWCYPHERDYKQQLREVYKNYPRFKSAASKLKKYVLKNFSHEEQHKLFAESVLEYLGGADVDKWLSEIFAEDTVLEHE